MGRRAIAIALWVLVFISPLQGSADQSGQQTSVFNETWLQAAVSVELIRNGKDARAIGTGFLLGTEWKNVLLVSAKHVVTDSDGTILENLAFRLNRLGGHTVLLPDAKLRQKGFGGWFISSTHDLALQVHRMAKDIRARGSSTGQTALPGEVTSWCAVVSFRLPLRSPVRRSYQPDCKARYRGAI